MFQVGGRYRNRLGEYQVTAIDGANMTIRFLDSRVIENAAVVEQARIWENIQIEERMAQALATESRPSGSSRAKPAKERSRFQGLKEHDFQKGTAGTSWRARDNLGGALAESLSLTTSYEFQSYAIYRRAEVHIAQPEYYDENEKIRAAKFVLNLNSESAFYGLYVERNDGPMDSTWDWSRFSHALTDTPLCHTLDNAMHEYRLCWEIDTWVGESADLDVVISPCDQGVKWQPERGEEIETLSWPRLLERINSIKADRWCNVQIGFRLPKEQAVADGPRVIDRVTAVYRALLPLYIASTR